MTEMKALFSDFANKKFKKQQLNYFLFDEKLSFLSYSDSPAVIIIFAGF